MFALATFPHSRSHFRCRIVQAFALNVRISVSLMSFPFPEKTSSTRSIFFRALHLLIIIIRVDRASSQITRDGSDAIRYHAWGVNPITRLIFYRDDRRIPHRSKNRSLQVANCTRTRSIILHWPPPAWNREQGAFTLWLWHDRD